MKWTEVKVVGKTLTLPNGFILSRGPLGWEPPRPPGTSPSTYENCDLDGSFATYRPVNADFPEAGVVVFPYRPRVPNTDGFAAIAMDDPL